MSGRWWAAAVGMAAILATALPGSGAPIRPPVPATAPVLPRSDAVVLGPDGAVWASRGTSLLRLAPDGSTVEFPTQVALATGTRALSSGPEGRLWAATVGPARVGSMTTGGVVAGHDLPTDGLVNGVAAGPDGNLWVTEESLPAGPQGRIVRVTPLGVTSEFLLGNGVRPREIVAGSDGAMWFTVAGGSLGRITVIGIQTLYQVSTQAVFWGGLLATDGHLWAFDTASSLFVDVGIDGIARRTLTLPCHPKGTGAASNGGVWIACPPLGLIRWDATGAGPFHVDLPGGAGAQPWAVVADAAGNLRVSDWATGGIPLIGLAAATRFVTRAYQVQLRRAPDAAGTGYWETRLLGGGGQPAAADAALAIGRSVEGAQVTVGATYRQLLRRDPDGAGLAYWTDRLVAGDSPNRLRALLAASDEYFTAQGGGTVEGLLTNLYGDLLGRAADAAGRAYWKAQIAAGVVRGDVTTALLASLEAAGVLVDRTYTRVLGRPADSGGRAYWANLLTRGFPEASLVANLLGSPEMYGS